MPTKKTLAFGLALLSVASHAQAWGFTAHRTVNRKAVTTLPKPLRLLFEANVAYLAEHAIDPDLWRAAGRPGEGPNHFLDMDAFGPYPFDGIPRSEADHARVHGKDALEKGRVPWRVAEVYAELVAAFRAGDAARTLERAAVLGHYVADAHVPLHAALNYDGQLSGQTGVHARWEAEMVERFERQIDAAVLPASARRIEDPVAFTFSVLVDSYARSLETLASDRESAGTRDFVETPEDDRYDDAYYTKLYEKEGRRLGARLAASATAAGSLWLSAWEDAGRPPVDESFRFAHVRKSSKAVLLSLDGASAPLLDDAVARGVMPRLAALRAAGAVGRSLTALPCKTAAGHAALFTGAWSDVNGISGNKMPVAGGAIDSLQDGFESTGLLAEPIWVTAARQGLNVTVVSAPQAHPFTPFTDGKRFGGNFGWNLTLMDGYSRSGNEDAVYGASELGSRPASGWTATLPPHAGELLEVEVPVSATEFPGGLRLPGLLYDDPADPVRGFDTLALALGKQAASRVVLKPRPALGPDASAFQALAVPVADGKAVMQLRLFSLSTDGHDLILYRTEPAVIRSNKARVGDAATEASGGFVRNGAGRRYSAGAFGPPLWKGGDGTAERRFLETLALATRQFTRLTELAETRTRFDLLVSYLPLPDEFFHAWLGLLDPTLPGHDPGLAARLHPFVEQALGLVDGYVGRVSDLAGPDTILAVGADHGMAGIASVVRPNVALAQAGLLEVDAKGVLDLARTRALYSPANSGYVLVNRDSRRGGIVSRNEEADVRQRAVAALTAILDPATGERVVLDLLDAGPGREPGIGGPTGGDLYLSLRRGWDTDPETTGALTEPADPAGEHRTDPQRPEMHAAFAIAGPGVAPAVDLGEIRQIDIAPTLCALLGIDPPAQATGQVLERALARH
jgi:predicted AlkP superfamily phosphohydrolase/phosphomutase